MSLLLLFQTSGAPPVTQSVTGTLTMSSSLTFAVRRPVAVTGTLAMTGAIATVRSTVLALVGSLQMSGVLGSVLRTVQAIAGTLTGAGAVTSTYFPPSAGDFLTLLRRRNQTD
jgi:hypothetical protein